MIARRSVLSAVEEHRRELVQQVGASDRARLDEYFTSLRGLEQQLDLSLQKPAPLASCSVPPALGEHAPGVLIDDVLANHRLFAGLLAHALACGQTRVFNVNLGGSASTIHKLGDSSTFHTLTHEEGTNPKLGYQPTVAWFMAVSRGLPRYADRLKQHSRRRWHAVDRCIVLYSTDTGNARYHSMENIPMMTAGGANGRLKTAPICPPRATRLPGRFDGAAGARRPVESLGERIQSDEQTFLRSVDVAPRTEQSESLSSGRGMRHGCDRRARRGTGSRAPRPWVSRTKNLCPLPPRRESLFNRWVLLRGTVTDAPGQFDISSGKSPLPIPPAKRFIPTIGTRYRVTPVAAAIVRQVGPALAAASSRPVGEWSLVDLGGGTRQWAHRGRPLYTCAGDTKIGDATGDGLRACGMSRWRSRSCRCPSA